MAVQHREDSLLALRASQPTPQELKLAENSAMCRNILENEFKSAVKGDGLQPYRMNDDDQKNLNGLVTIINIMLENTKPEEMPPFSWQNANQVQCADDWHYKQVRGLLMEYGAWKVLVRKRQDEIKDSIIKANTDSKLAKVRIDYSDLLVFGGGDGA